MRPIFIIKQGFFESLGYPSRMSGLTDRFKSGARRAEPTPEWASKSEIWRAANFNNGRKSFCISTLEVRAVEQLTFSAATTAPARAVTGTAIDRNPCVPKTSCGDNVDFAE
jgi:hypothetical protein